MLASHYNSGTATDADGLSRHHLVSQQHHVIMARHSQQVSSGWSCNQEDSSEAGDKNEVDGSQSKDGACQQIDPSCTLNSNTSTNSSSSVVSRSNCSSTATIQEGEEEVDEVEELLQNSVCYNSKFRLGGVVEKQTFLNESNNGEHQHNNRVDAHGNNSTLGDQLHLDDQETAGDYDVTFKKNDDITSCTNSDETGNEKLVDGSSVVADILSQVLEETDQFGLAYLHQSECRSNCSSSNSSSGISCSNRSNITSATRSSSSSSSASETNMENNLIHNKNSNNNNHLTCNMVTDRHNLEIGMNNILTSTINSVITNSPPVGINNNNNDGLLSNFCLTSSLLKQIHGTGGSNSDSGGGSSRKSSEGDEPVSLGNITSFGYPSAGPDPTGDMIDADQFNIAGVSHGGGYDAYNQFSSLRSGGGSAMGSYIHDSNNQFTTNADGSGLPSSDVPLGRLSSLVNPSSLFKAATSLGGNGTPEDEMKLLLPDLLRKREHSGSSRDSGYSSYFGTATARVHPTPSNNLTSNGSVLDSGLLSRLSRLTAAADPGLLLDGGGGASSLTSSLVSQRDGALTPGTGPFFKGKRPAQDTFDLNYLSNTNFSALSSNDVTMSDLPMNQTMPDPSSFGSEHSVYNLPSNNYENGAFNSVSLTPDDDSIFGSLTQNMSSEANASLPNQNFMEKALALDKFTMDDSKPSSWLNLEALLFKNGNSSNGNHPLGLTESGRMSVASVPSMDTLLGPAQKLERMPSASNGFRINPGNDFSLRPSSVHGNSKDSSLGPYGATKFQATNDFLSYPTNDFDDISQLLPSDPSAQEKFLNNIQLLNQLSNLSSLDTDRRLLPPVPPITANNNNNNVNSHSSNSNGFFNFSRSHSSVNFPTGQHHSNGPVHQFGPLHHRPQSGQHYQQTGQPHQHQQTGQYQQQGGPGHTSGQVHQGSLPDGFILSQLLEKTISSASNASAENSSFSSGLNNNNLAELASVLLNTCKVSTIDISLSEVQLMLRRASLNDPFARNWLSRNFEFQRILTNAGISKRLSTPLAGATDSSANAGASYPSMYSGSSKQTFENKYANSGSSAQGRMPPTKSDYCNWSGYLESNGGGGPDSLEAIRQMSLNTPRTEHRGINGGFNHHLNNGVDNFGRMTSVGSNSYSNDSNNSWNMDNYKITSLGNGGYITSKNCANFEKLTMHPSAKELPHHFSAPPPTPVPSAMSQGKGAFPFPPSTPRPTSLKDYSSFDQLNSSQIEFALNNMDVASAAPSSKLGREGFMPPIPPHHRLLHQPPTSDLMALGGAGGKASADDPFAAARQRIPPELLAAAAAAASSQGLGGGSTSGVLPLHLTRGGGSGVGAQTPELSSAAQGLVAALGGGRPPPQSSAMAADACFRSDMMPFHHNLLAYRQLGPLPPLVYSLLQRIEDCYDQFRQVERQRKKTEAELARCFPGRRVSSSNTISLPRLPHNPTRLDRLVLDHMREHARVITLVAKMERLRNAALQPGIHKSLSKWHSTLTTLTTLRHADITHIILPPHLLHPHHHNSFHHHHPGHPPPSLHNPLQSPPPLPPTPGPGGYQQYSNVEKVYGNPPSLANTSQPPPHTSTQVTPSPGMMSLQHLMSAPPPPISPHAMHFHAATQQHHSNNNNPQLDSCEDAVNLISTAVCSDSDTNGAGMMPQQVEGAASEVSSSASQQHQQASALSTSATTTASDIKPVKEEGPPEVVALSQCLCRVVQATRGARTALYCALTLTTLQHLVPEGDQFNTPTTAVTSQTTTLLSVATSTSVTSSQRTLCGGHQFVEGVTATACRPGQSQNGFHGLDVAGKCEYDDSSLGSGENASLATCATANHDTEPLNIYSTLKRQQDEDVEETREEEDDGGEDEEDDEEEEEENDSDLKLVEALKKLFHYRDQMKKIERVDEAVTASAEHSEAEFPRGSDHNKDAVGTGRKEPMDGPEGADGPNTTACPSKRPEISNNNESTKKSTAKKPIQDSTPASISSEKVTSLASPEQTTVAETVPRVNTAPATNDNKKNIGDEARVSALATVGNKHNSTAVATTKSISASTASSVVIHGPSKKQNNVPISNASNISITTSSVVTGNVGSKSLNIAGVTSSCTQQPTHVSTSSTSGSNHNRNSGHSSLFGSTANNGRKYYNGYGGGVPAGGMSGHYAKLGMAAPLNRRPPFHHHPPPLHHHHHHHPHHQQQPHHNNHYHHHRGINAATAAALASNLQQAKVNSINVSKVAAASANRDLRSSVTY